MRSHERNQTRHNQNTQGHAHKTTTTNQQTKNRESDFGRKKKVNIRTDEEVKKKKNRAYHIE